MSFGLARGKPLDISGVGLDPRDLPLFEVEPVVDVRSWFDDPDRPLQVEIGSGKGTFLVQQAEAQPGVNFVGFEWAREFFRYAADRIRRHGLTNVRLVHANGIEFLGHRFVPESAEVIHLYFPDPWPKKRHHKRRSLQDETFGVFHRVLTPGGEVRIVTDHDEYWDWICQRADRAGEMFERCAFERAESACDGEVVGTNFERKYRREGRPFHGMILRKRVG